MLIFIARQFSFLINLRSARQSLVLLIAIMAQLLAVQAYAAVTSVTPSAWDIIGLDSNSPAFGPNRFPVGATVCSDAAATVPVTFVWDAGGDIGQADETIITLRGSSSLSLEFTAAGCLDAFFEVEIVDRTSTTFDLTRRYHIEAGALSTPTPRELYVEHLISQSRNSVTDVKLDGASVPAGGTMALVVGNTYTIELHGGTATQGYNQFEAFINFPNTIFQILSVSTDYSANNSPFVDTTDHTGLYADACLWENDPDSPYYLDCFADYKTGGNTVVTIYIVKIISGGGSTETLNTLLYDFSGSSFHYNADYSIGARYASITDPDNIFIAKRFAPDPIPSDSSSVLTITLSNPNGADISDVSFIDAFPTSPGTMTVYNSATASHTCGGNLMNNTGGTLAIGDPGISYNAATIPANSSCTIKVSVAAPNGSAPAADLYTNTTGNLFSGTSDTGNNATDTLTVDDSVVPPPVPPSSCPGFEVVLARWSFNSATLIPTYNAASVTATASFTDGSPGFDTISTDEGNPANSWEGTGWQANVTDYGTSGTTPYYLLDVDYNDSEYGGVSIAFDYRMIQGNWARPSDNYLIIDSNDDGNGFTNIIDANFAKGSFLSAGPYPADTTGTSSTSFKFRAYGAKNTTDPLYFDNIVIQGCPVSNYNSPTITKSFSPDPVAVGQTSTLTFTVNNPNDSALSGLAFSDTFPTSPGAMTVYNTTTLSNTCGGSVLDDDDTALGIGDPGISLTGGTIAANSSCTVSIEVLAATAGFYENNSGFVSTTETGANTGTTGYAIDTLTVLAPPVITKSFVPDLITVGDSSTLTVAISNPNLNNSLAGIAFSDTFPTSPGAMTVYNSTTATNSCGGNLMDNSGGTLGIGDLGISYNTGTLVAGGSCSISVEVTAPAAGIYDNTNVTVSHSINSETINGNTTSASLAINNPNPPVILKQVGPTAIGPWASYLAVATGGNVYYRFTVENTGDAPLTLTELNDITATTLTTNCFSSPSLPFVLPVADTADEDHIISCVAGPITAVGGSAQINTANTAGNYAPDTTRYNSAISSAIYNTTTLDLVKSAAESLYASVGIDLHYSYIVTNNGAPLTGPVVVTDNKVGTVSCPALTTIGDFDSDLDTGESITCTVTYTTTAADVTNGQVTNTARAIVDNVASPTVSLTIPYSILPSLLFLKTVSTFSDPINTPAGLTPVSIPGAYMDYTLLISNSGFGALDNDSVVITDPIPTNSQLFVGILDTDQGEPVQFSDADGDSGFSLVLKASPPPLYNVPFRLNYFSDVGCTTTVGALSPDTDGFDANVRCLKISMDGIMSGTSDPSDAADFSLKFRVRID